MRRDITYKDMLIDDLQHLNRWRNSIEQASEELLTLDAEYTAIKATNYDKMPSGSGENVQEEKLITIIARKDELSKVIEANRLKVKCMERLLKKLPDDDRRLIERMVINGEHADRIAADLGYERRQVYNKRNHALALLASYRWGVAFHA